MIGKKGRESVNEIIKTKETAILVGCLIDNRDEERMRLSMEELAELADTAGVEVLDVITQNRDRIDPAWYLGTGKIDELAQRAEELDVDVVIFNDELSPSQTRNLDRIFDCKVIDRTQLILDIFAGRAISRRENSGRACPIQLSAPSISRARQAALPSGWGNWYERSR